MVLTKKWDTQALGAALKPVGVSDALSLLIDIIAVVFGWVIASLTLAAAKQPLLSIVADFIPQVLSQIGAGIAKLGGSAITISPVQMQLTSAWDVKALSAALEKVGVPDGEKFVNDGLPVLFDWVNSSLALNASAVDQALAGVAATAEAYALAQLKVLEAKFPA